MEFAWPEFTEHLLCVSFCVGVWDRAGTRPLPSPPPPPPLELTLGV